MAIVVKAIKEGYYGDKYREIGDIFEITDEHAFSANWMQKMREDNLEEALYNEEKKQRGRPRREE